MSCKGFEDDSFTDMGIIFRLYTTSIIDDFERLRAIVLELDVLNDSDQMKVISRQDQYRSDRLNAREVVNKLTDIGRAGV